MFITTAGEYNALACHWRTVANELAAHQLELIIEPTTSPVVEGYAGGMLVLLLLVVLYIGEYCMNDCTYLFFVCIS